jgi:predicted murein hydrolase (TIGR00659 family)
VTAVLESPFFGVALSVFAYTIGLKISKRIASPIVNPLLIAILLVVAFLQIFNIRLSDYERGGSLLTLMVSPATTLLAVPIYHRRNLLLQNLLPVVVGCFVGAAASLCSIFLLCRLLGVSSVFTISMMPKSVTTPIAMELSQQNGGLAPLTVAFVLVTGISGAIFSPLLIKILRIKNPVAAGIAIGATSHAIGTARALEIGETEGAMSGIAMGIAGVATVLLFPLF